ncbi:MAG: Iron-sulfur cluster repair protein ScdA [Verrucomicrobiae bacterium]|nr:Iron-sulfur cluster repair protein ScdA [Verrucomicrobiae bacterium]
MSLITTIKNKFTKHEGCGCGQHAPLALPITQDMIVRDVTNRWPETINVFGKHKVDFCCGGAHSIEQTARAKGCRDVAALVADLNAAVKN